MLSLTLACFPGACSRATMIALEEAGAGYDTHVANLVKGEQRSAAYLALNPKGKVPVLLVDGVPLTENVAILSWIADAFPEAALLPGDPMARAQAISAVGWLASAVLTCFGRLVRPERISADRAAAEGIKAAALTEIASQLAIAERALGDKPWWVETYSIADPYLYYIVGNAWDRFGVDPAPFPALVSHRARMDARPATQRMLAWERQTRARLAA